MNSYRIVKLLVLVFTLLLFAFFGNVLLYSTSTGYYVGFGCGDSMEPNYQGGDVTLNTGEYQSIQEGDVVRYINEEGQSIYHRVIDVNENRDNPYLIKGDNNSYSDGWYDEEDIKGKVVTELINIKELC